MKQVIQCHLALNEIAVFVFLHSISGNHGDLQGLPGSGHSSESLELVSEHDVIHLVYDKFIDRKFHLTKIYYSVPPFQNQFNLSTVDPKVCISLCVPYGLLSQDAGYAKLLFYLRNMILAELFKGQTGP